jgi:fructose-1,6-bisphosphatase/inositol monophosphatase family enzyme
MEACTLLFPNTRYKCSDVNAQVQKAVVEVGDFLLNCFIRNCCSQSISIKADGSWSIACEQKAQEQLINALTAIITHSCVYAEESTTNKKEEAGSPYCWIIDPLDGTHNFVRGVPWWALSLALYYNGLPIGAWIYDPVHKNLYYAVHDHGAFKNNILLSTFTHISASAVCVAISSTLMHQLISSDVSLRNWGSTVLHLVAVATGQLEGAICQDSLYDTAAALYLIQQAGGVIQRCHNLWVGAQNQYIAFQLIKRIT